jgi:hypothetical protein
MKTLFLGHFAASVAPRILSKVETPLETQILKNEGDGSRRRTGRQTPGPGEDRGVSFDDLVGEAEDRLRDRQTERLGSLQIDDELEFCRLLHG